MSIDFLSDDPRGRELQLLIERLKYERYLASQVDELLDREFNRLLDVILSGKYRDLTQYQKTRAAQLFRELDTRIRAGYHDLATLHVDAMQAYAETEAEIARKIVAATLDVGGAELTVKLGVFLPKKYLSSIARLPIQGLNIGEWFEAQAQTMSREVRRILQQGLIEGKGPAQIASRILADARAQGPVLLRRAKSEARAISRTIVNAVQNDAQIASLEALPDGVSDRYVWESVLDARTTPICRALSGRVFRYDDPNRRVPPAHVQCRSTTRALLAGIDDSLKTQSTPRTLTTYDAWLRQQSVTDQNTILGVTRAGYWRSGQMTLADAIGADNRVLTLKELRAKLGLDALATAGAA